VIKKCLLLFIMLFPLSIYADTCEKPSINDTQTSNDRVLTCDSVSKTTTTFTRDKEVIFDNGVCEVSCTENIIVTIDPIKKVLAGMSFSYPIYISAERKCNATYYYDIYESEIKRLVSEYASLNNTEKVKKGNELTNYYLIDVKSALKNSHDIYQKFLK